MQRALVIMELACERGGVRLFSKLSLRLGGGDVLALGGVNGAGKTSLLRMIAGLLPPVTGTICLTLGDLVLSDALARGSQIAWLGTDEAIRPTRTPRQHLHFYTRLYEAEGDVSAALQHFGLARVADTPCARLSAGQRRRLGLARLSLSARSVWLMDEPMALLDREGRALATAAMAAHAAGGGIVIAAGHDPLGLDCPSLVLEGAQ